MLSIVLDPAEMTQPSMALIGAKLRALLLALLAAAPLSAQEPQPASLAAILDRSEEAQMVYAWRFAEGDDPRRAEASFDDSGWSTALPLEPPRHDVAWFRRHFRIEERLVGAQLTLRVEAAGKTDVYLDGERILSIDSAGAGGGGSASFVFRSAAPVIAVRHECGCAEGFLLTIEPPRAARHRLARTALAVILTTLPAVLALIHLGLYFTDRKARENLFLALSLLSFAFIVAGSALAELQRGPGGFPLERLLTPSILSAAFFALMTYYVIRRRPLPRTWIFFAGAGLALGIASLFLELSAANWIWSFYFIASMVEVARLEWKSRTRVQTGVRPLLIGMIVLQIAIVLQILVVFGVLPGGFPWNQAYYLGLVAFAIGASIFTISGFASTRRDLERHQGEIASARKLQESMLPKQLPAVEGIDAAAWLSTATEVGGDYYDFRETPGGGLLVAIGDAAGHGLAAGAMVTAVKALFASVRGDEDLPQLLERCDSVLRRMDVRLFHMCLGLVRIEGGRIEVCSAAMPPALIHRASTGTVEELGAGGLPLGGRLQGRWESRISPLSAGDTILLASDGLGELLDPSGEPYGFDSVAAALRSVAGGSAAEVLDRLKAELSRWRKRAEQADDMTAVVIVRR